MEAFKEALNIMNRAIDSRERTKMRIISSLELPQALNGQCWECGLYEDCRREVGVDAESTCNQWRAF
jgi:hypothetical protein